MAARDKKGPRDGSRRGKGEGPAIEGLLARERKLDQSSPFIPCPSMGHPPPTLSIFCDFLHPIPYHVLRCSVTHVALLKLKVFLRSYVLISNIFVCCLFYLIKLITSR